MKCPKCHYLSFDPEPRCKNCGYDLDVAGDDLDLPLRVVDDGPARNVTLELVHPSAPDPLPEPEPERELEPALELVGAMSAPAPVRRPPAPARAPHTTTEMPLFVKAMAAMDATVIEEPVAPASPFARVIEPEPTPEPVPAREQHFESEPAIPIELPPAARPLSVRRPVEAPRPAPKIARRVGPLDRDLLDDLRRLEREETHDPVRDLDPLQTDDVAQEDVPISHRLGAAAFDGLLLGGIGAFVLWATLKVCDASPSDLGAAAILPMAIFLLAVAVAYLVMFTAANGQTVGKMLMGIRVVGEAAANRDRLTLGQAAGRSLLAPLSVAILGLGWIPAFMGRRLALHDRLAHTRVVRA